jgi:hypothetical protein
MFPGLTTFRKHGRENVHGTMFLTLPRAYKNVGEKVKYSYQSLHHIHSSLSHFTHLSKNIDRIDDTFLKFIKDRIYSKEDASSANTSTRILIDSGNHELRL